MEDGDGRGAGTDRHHLRRCTLRRVAGAHRLQRPSMIWRNASAALLVMTTVSSGCGRQSEATREAAAMQAATPNRVQADGAIRLTDADRAALGLTVQSAAEADLPNATLRF